MPAGGGKERGGLRSDQQLPVQQHRPGVRAAGTDHGVYGQGTGILLCSGKRTACNVFHPGEGGGPGAGGGGEYGTEPLYDGGREDYPGRFHPGKRLDRDRRDRCAPGSDSVPDDPEHAQGQAGREADPRDGDRRTDGAVQPGLFPGVCGTHTAGASGKTDGRGGAEH